MTFSTTEVFGFSESLIKFIRNSNTEVSTLGLNAEAWLTALEEKKKAKAGYCNRLCGQENRAWQTGGKDQKQS